jgi:hypothetical protein
MTFAPPPYHFGSWEVADPFLRRWLLADDTTDQ